MTFIREPIEVVVDECTVKTRKRVYELINHDRFFGGKKYLAKLKVLGLTLA